jgi:membrane-bound lytic murein transglycosylase A
MKQRIPPSHTSVSQNNRFIKTMMIVASWFILFFIAGCAARIEKPLSKTSDYFVSISEDDTPDFTDDLDWESLKLAIERSLQYYNRLNRDESYDIGNYRYTSKELKETLLAFLYIIQTPESDGDKLRSIRASFNLYKATGYDKKGSVLFTGYYAPVLNGSLQATDRFRYPIYGVPQDITEVNLGKFNNKYGNERIFGRILKSGEMVPYHSRAEIEKEGALKNSNLELAWVDDPISLFSLHVQGSGKIKLQDGNMIQVSYAGSNGRPFRSIATNLLNEGKIAQNEISYLKVKKYLQEHPDELSDILNCNERYIFFRVVENGPLGALQVPVTPGRSIATDLNVFPKGILAYVKTRKPVLDEQGNIKSWITLSRFVLNQDTGEAIKGPGRVDLFCGNGDEAEMIAGSLKEKGELYFLVKKR